MRLEHHLVVASDVGYLLRVVGHGRKAVVLFVDIPHRQRALGEGNVAAVCGTSKQPWEAFPIGILRHHTAEDLRFDVVALGGVHHLHAIIPCGDDQRVFHRTCLAAGNDAVFLWQLASIVPEALKPGYDTLTVVGIPSDGHILRLVVIVVGHGRSRRSHGQGQEHNRDVSEESIHHHSCKCCIFNLVIEVSHPLNF